MTSTIGRRRDSEKSNSLSDTIAEDTKTARKCRHSIGRIMHSVLFTNIQLTNSTGTEVVIRDLALGMTRRGHRIGVYSPRLGEPARRLVAAGIQVVDQLSDLGWQPDVIHGHHHTSTIAALDYFPSTPAVWVCHDRLQPEDIPPIHPAIRRYVAVDLNCRERPVDDARVDPAMVDLIHNAVDLDRFPLRAEWSGAPRRALVFSNQAGASGYRRLIETACSQRGIDVHALGELAGGAHPAPEDLLGSYELVFAKARCAIEALVSGCAVVLVDELGLGTVVGASTVDVQRDWNFGARCLQARHTVEAIGHEIDMIDAASARATSLHMRTVASLERALDQYERIYAGVLADGVPRSDPLATPLSRLLGYAGSLERRVRAADMAIGTVALPPTVATAVELRPGPLPVAIGVGERFEFDVTVNNRSRELLASLPPYPVHLGYHWFHDDPSLDVFDGTRTPFRVPLLPAASGVVRLVVDAPSRPGRWRLCLAVVQELVMWFDQVEPSHGCDLYIDIGDAAANRGSLDGGVTLHALLASVAHHLEAPIELIRGAQVQRLAFADRTAGALSGALLFAQSADYLDRALATRPAAVLTTAALAAHVPDDIGVLVATDPKRSFFAFHNAIARFTTFYETMSPSVIDPTATVHPSAFVDPVGVTIGPGCVIGPMCTITGRVTVGANTRLDAGAVIGASGFQTSSVNSGYVELDHVGSVAIGSRCHIYANAVIARGALAGATLIGDECQIGNGAFVSHETVLGDSVFVGHNATVNGHVTVGADAWIGPGVVIANGLSLGERCHVALGSTLISDVGADERIAGLPAMRQRIMFRHAASIRRADRRS